MSDSIRELVHEQKFTLITQFITSVVVVVVVDVVSSRLCCTV